MTFQLNGKRVALILAGFFGIIFATNAFFITAAVRTFRGEDEQLPYLQGVEYNHTLARRAAQAQLGWSAEIRADRLSSGRLRLEAMVRGPDGRARDGLGLTGLLRHPSDENRDRVVVFHPVSAGRYEASLDSIAPGAWDVRISNQGPVPFQAGRRLWVR
jgi:nitrogen fixation protein FixH